MYFDIFTGILAMYPNFHSNDSSTGITFNLNHSIKNQLLKQYKIDKIAGNGDDFEKISNLLVWITTNIYHNGMMMLDYTGKRDSITLLDRSFKKSEKEGLNCLFLSVVLSEILLSLGLKAFPIWMMPFSPYDSDNHVVVNVYVSEMKKWIMIDPTAGIYLKDDQGIILDSLEIRQLLAKRIKPIICGQVNYNNASEEEIEGLKNQYHDYIAKNSFNFMLFKEVNMGDILSGPKYEVCPIGFDIVARDNLNLAYREAKSGENAYIKARRKTLLERNLEYFDYTDIYKQ